MRALVMDFKEYWSSENVMWIGRRMTDVVQVCKSTNQTAQIRFTFPFVISRSFTHNNHEENDYRALRPFLEARGAGIPGT